MINTHILQDILYNVKYVMSQLKVNRIKKFNLCYR